VDNSVGITQIRCLCGLDCSEPVYVSATVEVDNEEHVLYYIYEASGVLPPLEAEGGCTTFIETYDSNLVDNEDEVLSALSFVGVACDDTYFLGGVATRQIWYEVTNAGEGAVTNPVRYPPAKNYFSPLQLFLSCGSEVSVFIQTVGYGFDGFPVNTLPSKFTFRVESWENGQEQEISDVQDVVNNSPNPFLLATLGYAILQTTTLPCFPPDTFSPLDTEELVNDILNSEIPEDNDAIINQAAVIALVTPEDSTTEQQEEVIDRLEDYLVAVAATNDTEAINALSASISTTASNILAEDPEGEVLDEVYELIENLQSTLLCTLQCGEEPTQSLSDSVQLGAQLNLLENLQQIYLGDLIITLPDDLSELQEELGGEGSCVQVGYSLITTEDSSAPTASLSFLAVNCETGEWEEIPVTLSEKFLISIPISSVPTRTETNNCGEEVVVEDTAQCVSGQTLTGITDPDGCEVQEVTEEYIICACTHLTAFSALFSPGEAENGECGGGWEWGVLQTVAVSLIAFCIIAVITGILLEHYLYYKPLMQKIDASMVVDMDQ